MIMPVGYSSTLRVIGIVAGPPVRSGAEIWEPASTKRANIGHSRAGNELARKRQFGSKTQFLPNFSSAARKFGGPLDPVTNLRKLLIRVGKTAAKISVIPITIVEFIVRANQ